MNYEITDFTNVAKYTRSMPDNFINKRGNFVTDDFIYYLQPLLGKDMQQASAFRAPNVKKIITL